MDGDTEESPSEVTALIVWSQSQAGVTCSRRGHADPVRSEVRGQRSEVRGHTVNHLIHGAPKPTNTFMGRPTSQNITEHIDYYYIHILYYYIYILLIINIFS